MEVDESGEENNDLATLADTPHPFYFFLHYYHKINHYWGEDGDKGGVLDQCVYFILIAYSCY